MFAEQLFHSPKALRTLGERYSTTSGPRLTLSNPSNKLKDSIQVQVPAYGREHSCEAPRREREGSFKRHHRARGGEVDQPAVGGCSAGGENQRRSYRSHQAAGKRHRSPSSY